MEYHRWLYLAFNFVGQFHLLCENLVGRFDIGTEGRIKRIISNRPSKMPLMLRKPS
jgi:hypothetical protein